MENAGDCIGDLERCLRKVVSRPLWKNEPFYRNTFAIIFQDIPGSVALQHMAYWCILQHNIGNWASWVLERALHNVLWIFRDPGPSWGFRPRPGNLGDYVAIVRLDVSCHVLPLEPTTAATSRCFVFFDVFCAYYLISCLDLGVLQNFESN